MKDMSSTFARTVYVNPASGKCYCTIYKIPVVSIQTMWECNYVSTFAIMVPIEIFRFILFPTTMLSLVLTLFDSRRQYARL